MNRPGRKNNKNNRKHKRSSAVVCAASKKQKNDFTKQRKSARVLERIEKHEKELCEIHSRIRYENMKMLLREEYYNYLKYRIREERIEYEKWQMYKAYEHQEAVYEGHDYLPHRNYFDVKFEMGYTETQIELTRRLVKTQFTCVTLCALRILETIKQQNTFLAICERVLAIVNDIICSDLNYELYCQKRSLKRYAGD